jgi:hypothetical protein
MSQAVVISGQPQSEREPVTGRRILLRELVVSLGIPISELERIHPSVRVAGGTTIMIIPKGFDHDWSSIPTLLKPVMGDDRLYDIAGIVHDWLYRIGIERRVADQVWLHVARSGERHVGPIRGWLGYAGLRLGGWAAYRRIRKQREASPVSA